MQYLTYDEYKGLGGVLENAAFNRNSERASTMIDVRTQSRLELIDEIPNVVKGVCADLIDYISTNTVDKTLTGRSQTNGPVSESESYAAKTAEDYAFDLERIFEPLATVKTPNGVPITYRGAMS